MFLRGYGDHTAHQGVVSAGVRNASAVNGSAVYGEMRHTPF